MGKLTKFRRAVLKTLARVPDGYMQRIDGIECSTAGNWWFFRSRVKLMVRAGLVRSRPVNSFWPSQNGMPAYAITPAGRLALEASSKQRGKADG